jgi:DNA-binding MarR family transcriptional regulator
MKIILSNRANFEITDEILTIEEFLTLADKLRELALTSRNLVVDSGYPKSQVTAIINQRAPNDFQISPSEPQPQQEFVIPIGEAEEKEELEDTIFKLKKQGEQLSDIARKFNISSSQARRLYQRVYQREWMRKNNKKVTKTRKPVASRWINREEVLNALKVHYFGTEKDKQNVARAKNKSWNDITKSFWALTKRHNIKPSELGLTKWGKERGQPAKQENNNVISVAEKQFIEFFENYSRKGGNEDELRKAVMLLREWLRSQGKSGNISEISDFLKKIRTLKPLISPEKLRVWFG